VTIAIKKTNKYLELNGYFAVKSINLGKYRIDAIQITGQISTLYLWVISAYDKMNTAIINNDRQTITVEGGNNTRRGEVVLYSSLE